MPEAVNPLSVWQPFGPFSMAMVQGDGRIIHLKGQVALDREGRVVGDRDMRAQLRQVLENIRAVLASMGGTMGDILSLVHYTTDIESFMKADDVRQAFFTAPYPVTTTVEVQRLYDPALLIEIAAIAEIPRERFRMPG